MKLVEITDALQSLLITIAVAAISILSGVAVAYLNVLRNKAIKAIEQMDNDEVEKVLTDTVNKAYMLVSSVVTSLEQEEKQAILSAIEDGEVTKEELYKLKDIAIDKVTNQLGPDAVNILEEAFGDVAEYIGDLVSAKVYELKQATSE